MSRPPKKPRTTTPQPSQGYQVQDIINALINQRNAALNEAAQAHAQFATYVRDNPPHTHTPDGQKGKGTPVE